MPPLLLFFAEQTPSVGAWFSTFKDALPFLGAVVAALLGWSAARFTAVAPQQMAFNDAFRSLVGELQSERAQHIVRISELESEIIRQRGVINSHLAKEDALLRILEKNGIMLPPWGHHS